LRPQQTLDAIHILADEQPSSAGGGSGETNAHQEGFPMVARPGKRSMEAVAVLRGRQRRRRGCRGAELVVVKSRVNGGRRWRPVCRQFPDSKGDGGLADSGSQISSRWPSGAGSQNEGSGIEGVSEQRQTAKEMMVKGSRRRQRARETKFCEVISGEKVGPNV
jgi:hypothetical protein